ncbi:MAG: metalloregulator ArsR/SmtB family transcription factor [bacterium]|nr:metalloregulator ArsR/SmtB family transcription factor [bacterium]
MVEYTQNLDSVFHSLSDPIRRDILHRVAKGEHSVTELVAQYDITFAAVSKHLKVLQKANLISKRKEGKKHMILLAPNALESADQYLEQYRQMWQSRHDKLAVLLQKET